MTQLSDIRPLTRRLVYDLAQEAGFDTSDWLASSNDSLRPKANPKYCYEWAYEEPGKLIVLNLWHEEMAEEDGRIVQRGNMRSEAGAHREAGGRQQWINRALRFDGALQSALRGGLPVRVSVLTRTAEKADPAKPSRVAFRALEDEPWTITNYDWISGEYELTRGLPYVDQFDITEAVGSTVERHEFSGSAFARDGAVRDRVLRRARGRCELCGELGFVTFGGRLYLETITSFRSARAAQTRTGTWWRYAHTTIAEHTTHMIERRSAFACMKFLEPSWCRSITLTNAFRALQEILHPVATELSSPEAGTGAPVTPNHTLRSVG